VAEMLGRHIEGDARAVEDLRGYVASLLVNVF
jgi:hypothetical protein